MFRKITNYANTILGNPYPAFANAILEEIKNKSFPGSKAEIHNLSSLCSHLEAALKKVILPEMYDQLDATEKKTIEQCIVNQLALAAKKCLSDNVNRIREGDLREMAGLQMQRNYLPEYDHYTNDDVAVYFPYSLFNIEKQLATHIVRALIENHSSILVSHAKYYLIDELSLQHIREVRKNAIVLGYLSQKQTLFTHLPYELTAHIASLTVNNNQNNQYVNLYDEANIAYAKPFKH